MVPAQQSQDYLFRSMAKIVPSCSFSSGNTFLISLPSEFILKKRYTHKCHTVLLQQTCILCDSCSIVLWYPTSVLPSCNFLRQSQSILLLPCKFLSRFSHFDSTNTPHHLRQLYYHQQSYSCLLPSAHLSAAQTVIAQWQEIVGPNNCVADVNKA